MRTIIAPVSWILLLLVTAAAITYVVGWWLDIQVNCVDASRVGPVCGTSLGTALAALWGIVAVCIVLIWKRFRNG
jgi:hypothetical protein